MDKQKIVDELSERHEGVHYTYTTCVNNGCWDASCIMKVGVKDNKVVSIEPDDSVNPNSGREDVSDEALKKAVEDAGYQVTGIE